MGYVKFHLQFEKYEAPGRETSISLENTPLKMHQDECQQQAEQPLCGIVSDSVTAMQALLYVLSTCSNVSLDTTEFAAVLISVLESKSEVGSIQSILQNYNNIVLN